MTNDWGLPDWHDPNAYGDVKRWHMDRWRWEFYRRRADLRAYFLSRIYPKDKGPESLTPGVEEPTETWIGDDMKAAEKFGYLRLPNPRRGDHSDLTTGLIQSARLVYQYPIAVSQKNVPKGFASMLVPIDSLEHTVQFGFDLDRPMQSQIENVRSHLFQAQRARHGKFLSRRAVTKKWLTYLRVLDAKEARMSWIGIAKEVLRIAPTSHAGRDSWIQANRMSSWKWF